MMKVGLETSPASRPSPAATPFASTVFPAPSSPQSASTSPGCARRARRSPIRSVCSEEWDTRSMLSTLRGVSARRSAEESAALKDEADGKPEEGPEERGPDEQPDVALDRAEEIERRTGVAAERRRERRDQRDEPEQPDEVAPLPEAFLRREELGSLLLDIAVGTLLLTHATHRTSGRWPRGSGRPPSAPPVRRSRSRTRRRR